MQYLVEMSTALGCALFRRNIKPIIDFIFNVNNHSVAECVRSLYDELWVMNLFLIWPKQTFLFVEYFILFFADNWLSI